MRLKICEYNVENLFISLSYYDGQDLNQVSETEWQSFALPQLMRRQKPLIKLRELAKVIADIDPDILMLAEVGGEESLINFNHFFLQDEFEVYFSESNSRRGIDLAYLVRKNLVLSAELHSNRDVQLEVHAYQGKFAARFARDVAELRLKDPSGVNKLILMLVHLKSKISSETDFQGADLRTAEAEALAKIYLERKEEFPGVPILIGGDFNSNLASPEFNLLRLTDLQDMHVLLKTSVANQTSLVHFNYKKEAVPQVLDYLLLSSELADKIIPEASRTYRYKTFYDIENELPQSKSERYFMPSDHYPLILSLNL